MGSNVLFSSGDFAVGGGDCLSNDGSNKVRFTPIFPASCTCGSLHLPTDLQAQLITPQTSPGPFVTSVGGTNGTSPEQAVFFSGGGFSNYFERPSYQSQVVEAFLATLGDQTYAGLFFRSIGV